MKNNFKKKITAILAATLAAVTAVIFLTIPVSAIEVVGNGSGGGSSSTTEGGSYSLPVLGKSTSHCAGYRLTVITASGKRRENTNTINVYCSNSDFADHIKSNAVYYSSGLYYKTEISSGFISGSGTNRNIGDKKFNKDTAIWNSSIPQDATQMTNSATGGTPYFKTTSGSVEFDYMCQKMGLSGASALQNGNKVLIEPLFLLTIANTEYLLTVTEIGLYGFKMFGDIVPASSGDTGSWANIAYYTNAYWPMSCRITENLTYSGTTIWYAAGTLTTGNPGRGSFGDLIKKGYGVAFAYNNTNPPAVPVDLYPVRVEFWENGVQVDSLTDGHTYVPKYVFYNDGNATVEATIKVWSHAVNKNLCGTNGTSISIDANSYYTYVGDAFKVDNNLYYVYNKAAHSKDSTTGYTKGYPTLEQEWNEKTNYDIGRFIYNSMIITLNANSGVTESNTSNNYSYAYTHVYVPVDLTPTGVKFFDKNGVEQTTLIDGQTYYPRYYFKNNGNADVKGKIAVWCQPLNKMLCEEKTVVIRKGATYEYNPNVAITMNSSIRYAYSTKAGGSDATSGGYPTHSAEWNVGRFLFNSTSISLISNNVSYESNGSNNYKEFFTNVYVPVDLRVNIEFYDKIDGTKQTSFVEGQTYYPKYIFSNYGNTIVETKVKTVNYPNNKIERNEVDLQIGAWSIVSLWGDPVTITKGRYFGDGGSYSNGLQYEDYTYVQNQLKHYAHIYLNSSSKVAVESSSAPFNKDVSNNKKTVYNQFSPAQPGIEENFLDDENNGSSWILSALNEKTIYSGQEIKGNVVFKNNSSFKLNIYDWAKVALGLESNRNYSYLNPPGTKEETALRNSGAIWSNVTSKFRVKNVPTDVSSNNETQKTLFLLAAAGETSYANATGTDISSIDVLADNVKLNNLALYANKTYTTNGNNLTQSWNNTERILTLNGRLNSSTEVSYINYDFKKGETYKITAEYVSGSISAEKAEGETSVRSCLPFNFVSNDTSTREWTDIFYPNLKTDNYSKTITRYLSLSKNETRLGTWIWLGANQSTVTFNNYRVKIKIERVGERLVVNSNNMFKTGSGTNSSTGYTLSQSWDSSTRTLTLNGSIKDSSNSIGLGQNSIFSDEFEIGNTYKITLEYLSGNIKGTKTTSSYNGFGACIAFDWSPTLGSRVYKDLPFPNFAEDSTGSTTTQSITLPCNADTLKTGIWTNSAAGEVLTFDNYKIKVTIERVDGLTRYLAYSTKTEGYTVIPTDLETSKIGLYDAETGERLDEGDMLKAGQKVYSETTYTNNTDTAVAVNLGTEHDNNTNTEYYMTDEADMSSSITTEDNEIPLDKLLPSNGNVSSGGSYSYDKSTGTLTLNGRYGNDNRQYVCFNPIDYVINEGERYRLEVEYISGSISNDEGVNMALIEGTTAGWDISNMPYYDFGMPGSFWTAAKITSSELEAQPINGSMSDTRLIIGVWCNEKNTSFNNFKIKISLKKSNPSLSWNIETETLLIDGDYSKNRDLFVRELSSLYSGSTGDGKLSFNFSSEPDRNSTMTLTFNGTAHGTDYMYSNSPFPVMKLLGGMDFKTGDKIRLKAEYVNGSISESSSNNSIWSSVYQGR